MTAAIIRVGNVGKSAARHLLDAAELVAWAHATNRTPDQNV
jgi:hypothetical protein